jgi:6-phosphogluconolactonase
MEGAGMIFVACQGLPDVKGSGGIRILTDDLRHLEGTETLDDLLYLAADSSGRLLFGVSGIDAGLVHAWRIGAGRLERVGSPVSSRGREPCHVMVDTATRQLVVANYGGDGVPGSVAVLPFAADGSLGQASVWTRTTSPGPDAGRQAESHIHQVVKANGDEILVVDLGADEVVSYLLRDGLLLDPVVSRAPAGSGPRHLVRGPNDTVAISGELGSALMIARRHGRALVNWTSVPATMSGKTGDGSRNYPSDIALDGDVVYLANRGADSIARLCAFDGAFLGESRCGSSPRQLAISGGRMFVSATGSDEVQVFRIPGMDQVGAIALPRPMCVVVTPDTAGS